MPIYTYICKDCGYEFDVAYSSDKGRKKRVKCQCGGKAEYDFQATVAGSKNRSGDAWTNHESLAMAVPKDMLEQTVTEEKKLGVSTAGYRVDSDGLAIPHFSSKSQKEKYLRAFGYYNKD